MKTTTLDKTPTMRDALSELVANIEMRASAFGIFTIIDRKTFLDAKAALAAPMKNCNVGTAEEQYARFVAMCHSNVDLSGRCRESCLFRCVSAGYCDRAECYAKWAQMPYEGGAK